MIKQLNLFSSTRHDVPSVVDHVRRAIVGTDKWPLEVRVELFNALRLALHRAGPFASEPVDCVTWVPVADVQANDYNPNSVAPPEMELLRLSILADGYTQPIVTWPRDGIREVVDGFHRNRVGKECPEVRERIHGYLPTVAIQPGREDKSDRIAATIRHNRARGKHSVAAMSDIVVELKRRNWADERIARELGMDQDEILRLCQITGLAELFSDQKFSQSWDVAGEVTESDFAELTDNPESISEDEGFRTVNTSDPDRIFHTYDKWECYAAGFYNQFMEGVARKDGERMLAEFLRDDSSFRAALEHVTTAWKHSCEHYLTNRAMNRIAWLGQAAACHAKGIPAAFRGGFFMLSDEEQTRANATALEYLNKWMAVNGRPSLSMEDATTDRQSEIY